MLVDLQWRQPLEQLLKRRHFEIRQLQEVDEVAFVVALDGGLEVVEGKELEKLVESSI
jgi:hypothetical protein